MGHHHIYGYEFDGFYAIIRYNKALLYTDLNHLSQAQERSRQKFRPWLKILN